MIRLERHIEILLLDNDCVIVPDFGGFMAHRLPATYSADEHLFIPPQRTIGFNAQLKLNDSLLVQSYIEAYDLSYPEAFRCIEAEVKELKQRLSNDGYYELKDIGTLYQNTDNIYVFEPCPAGILTPELYALSTFEINKLASDAIKPHDNEVVAEEQTTERPILPDTQFCIGGSTVRDEDIDDNDKVITIKRSLIRNVVAAAAVILALFVFAPSITNNNAEHSVYGEMCGFGFYGFNGVKYTQPQDFALSETTVVEDTITLADEIAEIEISEIVELSSDSIVKSEEIVEVQSASEPTTEYCLVLASMITPKNASKYVESLHKLGFEQANVYKHKDIVRVVYGSYETENAAYNDLRKLSSNSNFEQAWVYKKQ